MVLIEILSKVPMDLASVSTQKGVSIQPYVECSKEVPFIKSESGFVSLKTV